MNVLPEDQRNHEAFQDLHRCMHPAPGGRRPIAFVGAGVSVDAGYPTWNQLLSVLHREALGERFKSDTEAGILQSDDSLWRAQYYRDRLKARYYPVIQSVFASPKPPSDRLFLAEHLAALNFAHYLTTNYDDVLLKAVKGEYRKKKYRGAKVACIDAKDSRHVRSFQAQMWSAEPHVVHLHGRISDRESLVLTEADYLSRYRGSYRAERDIFVVLATSPVLFVGFSLSDPELAEILRVTRGEESGAARHFALLPLEKPGDEARIRALYTLKFGVKPIFYPSQKGGHRSLLNILKLLRRKSCDVSKLPGIGAAAVNPGITEKSAVVPQYPDDPQKGRWGGASSGNGRKVSAKVTAVDRKSDWFRIDILVEATNGVAFGDVVAIHVHDTFGRPYYLADQINGKMAAELTLHAYGAFTIGVECDRGATRLELDLAGISGVPRKFAEN